MAEYLASIFGTEKDKVNCSFYFKIGACRHGDRCSRLHNKPTFSQTIVLLNLYRNPQNTAQTADGSHCHVSDVEVQEHYDNFFEEVFTELQEKYGEIEEMNVCDNLGDHLVGNVYVKFRREEDAERAVVELNNRWFNGQAVHAELSPVTDFRESCCRQYEMGECTRGGFCNFMHLRPISRDLRRQLYGRGPRRRSAVAGSRVVRGPQIAGSARMGPLRLLPTAVLLLAQAAPREASQHCGRLEYWNPDNRCCGSCLQRFGPPPCPEMPSLESQPLSRLLDELEVLEELILLLDPEPGPGGRMACGTTRHLAARYGLPATWSTFAYSLRPSRSPLRALIEMVVAREPSASLGQLGTHLAQIGRADALQVLSKLG
ncbi:hypothetical protein G4228_002490 [Cervus hanglu yarkandensis]|nr:hypothetical protein G4228_002490 [Cervus hanglu yarkandensis]